MWDRLESLNIPPATIPVALVAFLLLLFPFANARRSRKMEYTVKWGRERSVTSSLPFPDSMIIDLVEDIGYASRYPRRMRIWQ